MYDLTKSKENALVEFLVSQQELGTTCDAQAVGKLRESLVGIEYTQRQYDRLLEYIDGSVGLVKVSQAAETKAAKKDMDIRFVRSCGMCSTTAWDQEGKKLGSRVGVDLLEDMNTGNRYLEVTGCRDMGLVPVSETLSDQLYDLSHSHAIGELTLAFDQFGITSSLHG